MHPKENTKTIDVGSLLDDGPFSRFQKWVVLLAALAIILDGFDSQLIGYAAPSLMEEWGVSRNGLMPAVVASVIGMGFGSAASGLFADRFGRKKALLLSLLMFSVFTGLAGFQHSVAGLAVFRFIAGLGIGGALPVATTMAAELTPKRYRTVIVTATIVCIPLGGMVAGIVSEFAISAWGWRSAFYIGGVLPLLLIPAFIWSGADTPKYLARFPERHEELRALLGKMGFRIASGTGFSDGEASTSGETVHKGYGALFKNGFARDTAALWCAFFFCLAAVYAAFSWLPTMLTSEDIQINIARQSLTAYNIGGVIGALACAWAITRLGSLRPLVFCAVAGAATALSVLTFSINNHIGLLVVIMFLHGLFVNAIQSTMYALCAYIYPTRIRATGTAGALVFGRVGAVAAAFGGAPVITYGGSFGYLWMLAGCMIMVAVSLLVIKNHIPARS